MNFGYYLSKKKTILVVYNSEVRLLEIQCVAFELFELAACGSELLTSLSQALSSPRTTATSKKSGAVTTRGVARAVATILNLMPVERSVKVIRENVTSYSSQYVSSLLFYNVLWIGFL